LVTSVARTIIDLAESLSPEQVVALVDESVSSGLTLPSRLVSAADRLAARGVWGPRAVSEAVRPWVEFPLESVAEAQLARWLARSGLPPAVAQYEVTVFGHKYRLDYAWPDRLGALEMDGFAFHSKLPVFVADRIRMNRLMAAGWTIARTTVPEIRSGAPDLRAVLFWLLLDVVVDPADVDQLARKVKARTGRTIRVARSGRISR
jgi:hypothetical protein